MFRLRGKAEKWDCRPGAPEVQLLHGGLQSGGQHLVRQTEQIWVLGCWIRVYGLGLEFRTLSL